MIAEFESLRTERSTKEKSQVYSSIKGAATTSNTATEKTRNIPVPNPPCNPSPVGKAGFDGCGLWVLSEGGAR
jgi:hypothetical protein